MIKINYCNEIKETLVKNEIYKKVKDYSKNKSDLNAYFEVGRLIVEAQGGEKRAKYGNKLIKEYSEKLTNELGKGYNATNLKRMRQFYLMFQKGAPVAQQLPNLTWGHYSLILPLKELGIGFTYVGSEVKIKIGDTYNYIDFLFFNTNYNCYVVITLKVTELKPEHLGQISASKKQNKLIIKLKFNK